MKAYVCWTCLVAVSAFGQQPDYCPPPMAKEWAAKKTAILKARKGEKHYLPKPFPKTEEDFRVDVRYSWFKWFYPFAKKESDVRAEDREIFSALITNAFDVEIIPVINWRGTICQDKLYLVRLYRQAAPTQPRFAPENFLASIRLDETGEVAGYAYFPKELGFLGQKGNRTTLEDRLKLWPQDFREHEGRVKQKFGLDARAVGYVAIVLPGDYCDVINPCVLLDVQGQRYLYLVHWIPERERLYKLDANPRLVTREEVEALGGERPDPSVVFHKLFQQTGRWPAPWGYDSRGKPLLILLEEGVPPRLGEENEKP